MILLKFLLLLFILLSSRLNVKTFSPRVMQFRHEDDDGLFLRESSSVFCFRNIFVNFMYSSCKSLKADYNSEEENGIDSFTFSSSE
ncbi:hypothetical protein Lalb_Chr19g0128711 [Lupinus albus]|uniref:Secreted protein n=1 Tax=Lupinus albus TaxID=3870 RepID=A0A6A4NTM0_LUPAL|nr:hypothetical protein Lalb_Chr19g0128711 [Lupinus albus]